MDAAGRVRRAALETLAEIQPVPLSQELRGYLSESSMVPGVVTLRTAERLGASPTDEEVLSRAVAIQLSYDGLRRSRQLIREEEAYGDGDAATRYLALVGGEVLVSRGFLDLAETTIAERSIEVLRRFSRNQSLEYTGSGLSDRTLERDTIVLAVHTGASTVLDQIPGYLSDAAERLALDLDREPFPPVAEVDRLIRAGLERTVKTDDAIAVND